MSDNALPPLGGSGHGPGADLYLRSLAPQFDSDQHQIYANLLIRALNAEGTKNIALTGAYGTGKSSILSRLRDTHGRRVVELSLSTIAPTGPGTDAQGEPLSRTNQIQKELVKQLLYRLPASSVPQSRFRRASVPNRRRDWVIAGIGGSAAFILLFGLGLIQPFVETLLPLPWRQWVAYGLLLGAMVGATWTVLVVARGRHVVSASVQTGAATITLSKESETYFDEYLDEIVYFFQASGRDIVLIEDIDRFEDVQVFDTLRSLNSLLNESSQIGRRIVFVYAIRDSVFEEIGSSPSTKSAGESEIVSDRAKWTLKRASRTKFFDVIIPVVPFVSSDNARDIMSDAMKSDDFEIDPALIRLAARHVADMRMIHNIRNEFEVYRNRLVVTENRIPGIDSNLVFAIVLYKNTHLADFEKIRHRESSLDLLYNLWRALVQENVATETTRLAKLIQQRDQESTSEGRAQRLGRQLEELTGILGAAALASSADSTVELGAPVTSANLTDPAVWAQIVADDSQTIRLHNPVNRYQTAVELSFTKDQLSRLLHTTIDDDDWKATELATVEADISRAQENLEFLRHHTWQKLAQQDLFTVDPGPFDLNDSAGISITESLDFDRVIDAALESDLAREMVRHGFITTHFSLYTSSYYGNHLGPDAMEYIRRCIEPGEPDMLYEISEPEVAQILREQGAGTSDVADLFSDASIFNVSIVDYLISHRPEAVAAVAKRLGRLDVQERAFLDTYTSHGAHPNALFAAMTPYWNEILNYVASARHGADARAESINAVLSVLPNSQYEANHEVASIIESSYKRMDAITKPASEHAAQTVFTLAKASGVSFTDVTPLSESARQAAVKLQLFPLTENNMRVFVPLGTIALDTLRADADLYRYTLERLLTFLALAEAPPSAIQAVSDPNMLSAVLTDLVVSAHSKLVDDVIRKTDHRFRVPRLSAVPSEAWPPLAIRLRTDSTFENVWAYIAIYGIDTALATLLSKSRRIVDSESHPEPERLETALTILNARVELASSIVRVRIAKSVNPGMIPASRIQPESGDLVARLIRARLAADDETIFEERLMIDWPTLAATIEASKNFVTFASPRILAPRNVPALLRRPSIKFETRRAIASDLRSYVAESTRSEVFDIAKALVETGWQLPYETLEVLRTSGATAGQVVSLIHKRGDALPINELKTLLQALGGEYLRISVGGRGQPTFTVTDAHSYILNRLLGDTVKAIETKSFKIKGSRLVATLQT
jgi:hypothetical protein